MTKKKLKTAPVEVPFDLNEFARFTAMRTSATMDLVNSSQNRVNTILDRINRLLVAQ